MPVITCRISPLHPQLNPRRSAATKASRCAQHGVGHLAGATVDDGARSLNRFNGQHLHGHALRHIRQHQRRHWLVHRDLVALADMKTPRSASEHGCNTRGLGWASRIFVVHLGSTGRARLFHQGKFTAAVAAPLNPFHATGPPVSGSPAIHRLWRIARRSGSYASSGDIRCGIHHQRLCQRNSKIDPTFRCRPRGCRRRVDGRSGWPLNRRHQPDPACVLSTARPGDHCSARTTA